MSAALKILPKAAHRAAVSQGDLGLRWIARLDDTIAAITTMWRLVVIGAFDRSSESLVLIVRQTGGNEAVLKLGRPNVNIGREAFVLGLNGGRVLPKVLDYHPGSNALLLEALGPPIVDQGWTITTQMQAICRAQKKLWSTPTTGSGLVKGSDRANSLRMFLENSGDVLRQPYEQITKNRAIDYAAERADAHRDDASVLVHGDASPRNALLGRGGSISQCRLIDPKGYYAEPACDVAIHMRRFNEDLSADPARLGRERCAWLAETTDLEERAIWQWGFMERVASGVRISRLIPRSRPPMLGIAHEQAKEWTPP